MEQKRHTVSKRNTRSSGNRLVTVLIVMISIVLIACIVVLSPLGGYLTEHVIDPIRNCKPQSADKQIVSALKQQEELLSQPTSSPMPSINAHEVITVDEVPFYILQMGAFTNISDANRHADEIMRMGAGGKVYPDGSVYRVFAAAYTDENSLISVQNQVRADGFEATPYITESSGLKITLDGDQAAVDLVKEAVNAMNRIPSELCTLCLAFDKGDLSEKDLNHELDLRKEECLNVAEKLEKIKGNEISSIMDLLQKYAQNISTFLKEHDTIQTEMLSGNLKHLQLSVIIDYILFFDRK